MIYGFSVPSWNRVVLLLQGTGSNVLFVHIYIEFKPVSAVMYAVHLIMEILLSANCGGEFPLKTCVASTPAPSLGSLQPSLSYGILAGAASSLH